MTITASEHKSPETIAIQQILNKLLHGGSQLDDNEDHLEDVSVDQSTEENNNLSTSFPKSFVQTFEYCDGM